MVMCGWGDKKACSQGRAIMQEIFDYLLVFQILSRENSQLLRPGKAEWGWVTATVKIRSKSRVTDHGIGDQVQRCTPSAAYCC